MRAASPRRGEGARMRSLATLLAAVAVALAATTVAGASQLIERAAQAQTQLRLSHWTGDTAHLEISTDWSYRKYDHLFGTYTYGGTGVYGFSSTSAGNPLDSFGRNIYLDTFDSAYGGGWKRDN